MPLVLLQLNFGRETAVAIHNHGKRSRDLTRAKDSNQESLVPLHFIYVANFSLFMQFINFMNNVKGIILVGRNENWSENKG